MTRQNRQLSAYFSKTVFWSFVLGLLLGCTGLAHAQKLYEAFEGKAYIASLRGRVVSSQDSKPLQRGQLISATENTISTDPNSFVVIVLSNGLSIYCSEQAQFTLITLQQEPFDAENLGLIYEPSRSNTVINLQYGDFGFAHRIAKPTSTINLKTPYGDIEPLTQSLALSLQADDARLLVFEQSARVRLKNRQRVDLVQTGQWMNLKSKTSVQTGNLIQKIRAPDLIRYQTLFEKAQNMCARTYFSQEADNNVQAHILFLEEHFSQQPINPFTVR